MARVLLPGVLLLAALCGIGETADACQYKTFEELWSCVNQTMDQKRDKLAARVENILPTFRPSGASEYDGIGVTFWLNNISVEHVSSIQLMDPGSFYQGNREFRSYWQPSIKVAMAIKFLLCTIYVSSDNVKSKGCFERYSRPKINVKQHAYFVKPWTNGEAGSGGMLPIYPEADIDLDLIKPPTYDYESPTARVAWASEMTEYVEKEALRKFYNELSRVLNSWFDDDVFQHVSGPQAMETPSLWSSRHG